jgi:hypothetical protein
MSGLEKVAAALIPAGKAEFKSAREEMIHVSRGLITPLAPHSSFKRIF